MDNYNTSGGIGFFGLLTLVFVVAKIMGFITWSWWLVFLPILIPLSITLVVLCIVWLVIAIRGY